MAAALDVAELAPRAHPIVIVGSGPVGVRVASELHRRAPEAPVVLYGAEAEAPYNRVRLSALLAGEIAWAAWAADCSLGDSRQLETRFGCRVVDINRAARTVTDERGRIQPYSRLVIATGSDPVVPNIPNIRLAGVYTFRNLRDAQQLLARRMRSRRTVVIGGGLLGLEAARAMRRFHTHVTVIEHAPRLMPRQLDEEAGALLASHLERLSISLRLGVGVKRILGELRVEAIQLMDGSVLDCDTIVVAAGIRPCVELARRTGLRIGRGIRVDDRMQTSDPNIYAVGECAEHRDVVHGLVAPGFEQASVVASNLCGPSARYRGSIVATRLKVLDLPVFSIGRVADDDLTDDARQAIHRKPGSYCKVTLERRRIVGAVAVGEVAQLGRLQEAVTHSRLIWPWQLRRLRTTGSLWVERKAAHISRWPDHVTVCNCMNVTRGMLGKAMTQGACSVDALCSATGAASVCGSCKPLLSQLCGSNAPLAVPAWRSLLVLTALAVLLGVLLAQPVDLDYAASVEATSLDFLWRTSSWKQASGYATAALAAVGLLLSLRKRVRSLALGTFDLWRLAHLALGCGALLTLLIHTGGRMGSQLDALLMGSFVALAIAGAAASGITSLQHRMSAAANRLRSQATWVHIVLFWPVPLLLGVHIFKSYYF